LVSFGPILAILPWRIAVHRQNTLAIAQGSLPDGTVFQLPWRELRADLTAWLVCGAMMVALYELFFDPYIWTGFKVMIGCAAFGIFGGMFHYLGMESRIIAVLATHSKTAIRPRMSWSVSRKMFVLIMMVLSMMALAILMMVLLDVYYLVENGDMPTPDLYWGIFKEIFFALAVLMAISLMILKRYSQNLKRTVTVQLDAMEEISQGNLDRQVPVLSGDEFAQYAHKTNEMLEGLKERDLCHDSFDRYVSPEISRKILQGDISPEGDVSDVTVLFCDLRGYTSFVEKRNPREVVAFMNLYFSRMEAVIRDHGGLILQYIGDEIEAVFGAPIPVRDHPDHAVAAALAMRQALATINAERQAGGEDPIQHGIGIHSGSVLAGNVGSAERMVYAMVGDTVNVASRLQVLNKSCGTDILISRTTRDRLLDPPKGLSSKGVHPIKGKSAQVEVFTIG
jgi:adenylate cyclase